MSDISLTSAERSTLLLLQRTADVRNEAARRLATGLRVENTVDDPVAFNQSSSLQNRVSDLLNVKDDIGQGLSAVEATIDGLDALSDLTDQLQGVARSALGGTDAQRAAAAEQFDTLRQQFDALAADVTYGGVSLLTSNASQLSVPVNETGTDLVIDGSDVTATGQGLGTAAATFNNFATDADVQAALNQLDDLQTSIRSVASTFGGDVASLTVREIFNERLANTLETGAQKLVEADLGEEAATLLAADVRDQLGLNGLQIVQQNSSLIADLL